MRNFLSTIKRTLRRGVLLAGVAGAMTAAGFIATSSANAASTNCNQFGFNGDTNAVIWCGAQTSGSNASPKQITDRYNNGDGHNSAASIHTIYNFFGISSGDIQSLSKNAVPGSVSSNGDVIVNNKVVARNVLTAGRTFMQNKCGTSTPEPSKQHPLFYVRKPCVSFASSPLSAYVVMKDHQFDFAILLSCGNPVMMTQSTPKTPKYTINKLVAPKSNPTNLQKNITVQSGDHVIYQITVDSNGSAPVTNLKVHDKLPQNTQFVGGTLQEKIDGKAVPNPNSSDFFGDGIPIASLAPGSKAVFTFEAQIGVNDTVQTCQPQPVLVNTAMANPGGQSSTATVSKTCSPKPEFKCTSLTPFMDSRTDFTFTAVAEAKNGASITAYTFDFGDQTSKTVNTNAETTTAQHSYANPGTYNVSVTVTITVGGTTQTVTSPGCATQVTVTPPPPSAECTDLTLANEATNPRDVTATAAFTTSNGATLTGASFDWGDNTPVQTVANQATATHDYTADGTFTVKATLSFSAPSGTVPDSHCQAQITVTTVAPTCDKLTLDINNDTKTVTVTSLLFTANNSTYQSATVDWGDKTVVNVSDATGQQHTYTADGPFMVVATPHFLVNGVDTPVTSVACQQQVSFTEAPKPPVTPPQTPPTQLVNTGAGNVIGIFGAATFAGMVAYRRLLNRRLSRPANPEQ